MINRWVEKLRKNSFCGQLVVAMQCDQRRYGLFSNLQCPYKADSRIPCIIIAKNESRNPECFNAFVDGYLPLVFQSRWRCKRHMPRKLFFLSSTALQWPLTSDNYLPEQREAIIILERSNCKEALNITDVQLSKNGNYYWGATEMNLIFQHMRGTRKTAFIRKLMINRFEERLSVRLNSKIAARVLVRKVFPCIQTFNNACYDIYTSVLSRLHNDYTNSLLSLGQRCSMADMQHKTVRKVRAAKTKKIKICMLTDLMSTAHILPVDPVFGGTEAHDQFVPLLARNMLRRVQCMTSIKAANVELQVCTDRAGCNDKFLVRKIRAAMVRLNKSDKVMCADKQYILLSKLHWAPVCVDNQLYLIYIYN